MSYVDAGYAIGLSTLFVYALSLVLRRRRLERAVAALEVDERANGAGRAASAPEPGSEGSPPSSGRP